MKQQKNLSAYTITGHLGNGYQFSIDPKNAAATLRDIADKIESGQFLLQSTRMTSLAKPDDFPMTLLRLVIHEGPRKLHIEGEHEWPGFTCPTCGRTSFHPKDVQEKYCGFCHKFTGEEKNG